MKKDREKDKTRRKNFETKESKIINEALRKIGKKDIKQIGCNVMDEGLALLYIYQNRKEY